MTENGLRLISFDCGGIRSLSQLKVMQNIIHRIQYDRHPDEPDKEVLPCKCFDAMGGSDTGGLIALMFCKLCMSVQDTIEEFYRISKEVYADGLSPEERSSRLRECIEDLLRRRGLPIDLKMGKDSRVTQEGCPCFVIATPTESLDKRVKLRTYRTRAEPASEITVVEAILATCATQPTFLPISIGPELTRQELVGGALSAGNPTRELILEAYDLFGKEAHVSTIVSVGSGHLGPISAPLTDGKEEWMEIMRTMVQNCEKTAQDMATQAGHLGLYHRFSVEQGLQRMFGVDSTQVSWLNAQTQSYVDDIEVSRKIDHCVESLRLRQGQATLEKLKYSSGTQPIYKSTPPLSSYFVMRKEPWEKMKNGIIDCDPAEEMQRILVVSGMGGCGKTQLVVRFIHEYKAKFKYTFFVDGSTRESIQADIINQVRTASTMYSQASFSEALRFFLNPQHQPCLLIYDNVDDVELDINSLIPECTGGAVIITTRNRSRGQLASPTDLHLELDVMSMEEATDVIIRSAKLEPNDGIIRATRVIANELGNLPVALVQAGSYIREIPCSCDEYLERLQSHKSEMMYTPASDRLQRSAYAAFDISYQRLPINVQNFLHLIGCLHFSIFPVQAIAEAAKSRFSHDPFLFEDYNAEHKAAVKLLMDTFCPTGAWDHYELDKMKRTLQNYSLVTFTKSGSFSFLRIHPLIHQWAFDSLPLDKRTPLLHAASRLIASASSDATLHHYLVPHIDALQSHCSNATLFMNDMAAFGHILREMRRLDTSRVIWEYIYNTLAKNSGDFDLHVATAAIELASTCEDDFKRMEKLEKQAISIRERVIGAEKLETLDAKKELAGTYSRQMRLKESEVLYTEVLESLKATHSLSHEKVLELMECLGYCFWNQGRYSEAEKVQVQVLDMRTETLGEDHKDTLVSMHALAKTYYSQDRYDKAISLLERAVSRMCEIFGDRHPISLGATQTLTLTYYSRGHYDQAEPLQERCLKVSKELLGEAHRDTIHSMINLSHTYYGQQRFDEAKTLQIKVLELSREHLGETHELTITAMNNLAMTYIMQDCGAEAEPLQKEVLEVWKNRLGDNHPNTLKAENNLAMTYTFQERYTEAEPLQQHVLKEYRSLLGETHSDTITVMSNLGMTYKGQGRFDEAELLLKQALPMMKEIYGPIHFNTLGHMTFLADMYSSQGRHSEALELQECMLEELRKAHGESHIDTLVVMKDLAWTYYRLGKREEAKELAMQVEKIQKDLAGTDDWLYEDIIQLLEEIEKEGIEEKEVKKEEIEKEETREETPQRQQRKSGQRIKFWVSNVRKWFIGRFTRKK